jgi:ligand-binding sensor domain-containing protein
MCVTSRNFKILGCTLQSLGFLTVWLLLGVVCPRASAQTPTRSLSQFAHRSFVERDGAPAMPMALAQTSDGYLWVGGGTGLFRFDGVHFEAFKAASATKLPHKAIIHLLALPNGKLWVGFSMGGLSVIDNGNVTNYTVADGLPPNELMEPVRDSDDHIWVSTDNGIARFDGKRWEKIDASWNCPQKPAGAIFVDSRGTIWVAMERTILYLPKGSHRFEETGDYQGQAYQFAEAPSGEIWVADAEEGVRPIGMAGSARAVIARCQATRARVGKSLDGCHAEFQKEIALSSAGLLFDHDGALWMTTLGQGLLRVSSPERMPNRRVDDKSVIDNKSDVVERLTAKDGLSSDYMVPILADREGNIWVGTRDGLDQVRETPLVPVPFPSSARDFALTPGDNGYMWVVSNANAIVRLHGEALPKSLKNDGFSESYPTKETRYFIAKKHLYRLAEGRLQPVAGTPANVLGLVQIVTTTDSKGVEWAMVEGEGLFFLKDDHWIRTQTPPEIREQRPVLAYTDPKGRMWFGFAKNIIVKFEESKFEVFSAKVVGSAKAIFGRDQHLWVGGAGGLFLFDGTKFRSVLAAEPDPLFQNVSGIVESSGHGLWLTTSGGVIHIPETEMRKVLSDPAYIPVEKKFDSQDGVLGMGQYSPPFPTAEEGDDGKIWFAAARGVSWVDPARTSIKSVVPPVLIKAFMADSKAQILGGPMRLPSRTTNFQIDYTALSLSIPERVKFRYRLDGLDDSWQDAGTRREAYFSRLRPGHYTFHVIACNGDGLWNETGATLEFNVVPTFFQTSWFIILCVSCCLMLIWVTYSLRIGYVTAQIQKRLGARMEERERIARELHDTLLQGFQGLTLRFQAVMKTIPVDQPAHQMMARVLDRADEVLFEGRQSVRDLREKGSSGTELADTLSNCGQERALGHLSIFSLTVVGVPQPTEPVIFDESYRIAREALINAFQHSKAAKIEAEVTYSESGICIRVRDDGMGIDPDIVAKGRGGHWGLSGMRERALNIGAKVNVWSSPGSGTEVELTIPAGVAYAGKHRRTVWQRIKQTIKRSEEARP